MYRYRSGALGQTDRARLRLPVDGAIVMTARTWGHIILYTCQALLSEINVSETQKAPAVRAEQKLLLFNESRAF